MIGNDSGVAFFFFLVSIQPRGAAVKQSKFFRKIILRKIVPWCFEQGTITSAYFKLRRWGLVYHIPR